MTTSQNVALLSELHGDEPLSSGTRAFLGARARQAFFSFVHDKLREAKNHGLTQVKLAKRIGKDPGRLSNTLSSPGNWTIDTLAELIFGICEEELVPDSRPLLGRQAHNARAKDLLGAEIKKVGRRGDESGSAVSIVKIEQEFELVQ